MDLKALSRIFNRSCEHIFNVQKLLSVFSILLFSGLIFLFFQSFVGSMSLWAKLPLLIIPFFVMSILLMILGTNLISTYAQEREGRLVKKSFFFSKALFLRACYFLLPLFFTLLILWALLGVFILLTSIPYLGIFLSIISALGSKGLLYHAWLGKCVARVLLTKNLKYFPEQIHYQLPSSDRLPAKN